MDGNVLQFKVNYKNVIITFRDSNRIFASELKALPKMFFSEEDQKKIYKEIFPYGFYTKTRYINNIGSIDEAMKSVFKNTKDEFIESLQHANAMIECDKFDL